ncbi:NAD(P)H-binding protein [Roseibium sp. MMSF_3412]|uniref:NAD(P)H-binding protein n=1 Tax=Roseibium sp. MMSF_3412 TaxID=3046712 RepID=UPI00273F0FEF|nr:NAD(P)H-binding protein [Roseibium sp. MMSF_3412]
MKLAVTAASGQLGRAVIDHLKTSHPVENIVGIARTPEKAADLGVEIRQGTYGDRTGFEQALAGVEAMLLISGNDAPEKRIEQHRAVIDGARAAGVQRFIYTSVQGPEQGGGFADIVRSNRQTEADVRQSGLNWAIGRNGIYIEPDVEYIDSYKRLGGIRNCAGGGLCAYTTRTELAYAYACLLKDGSHGGKTYNLSGTPISQTDLVGFMNQVLGTRMTYEFVDADSFKEDRIAEIGEFYGTVVAGIYAAIATGAFDNESQFMAATGREHVSWPDFFSKI